MPLTISILCVLAVGLIWFMRTKGTARTAGELVNAPRDVRVAARRFGVQRRDDLHPVDSISDPAVAVAALSVAFLGPDDTASKKQRDAMLKGLRSELNLPATDVEELIVLAQWLVAECGGAGPATKRIAAKLYQLDDSNSLGPVMRVLKGISMATSDAMTDNRTALLDDIKRAFRLT